MMLDSKSRKKYLTISPVDLVWGLAVNSVGRQNVTENEVYPPQDHPTRYLFNTQNGKFLIQICGNQKSTYICGIMIESRKAIIEKIS